MPTLHVVSTKQFTFRGAPERFSNGYNFQLGTNDPTPAFCQSVYEAIRDMERSFHASEITFPYAVVGLLGEDAIWSQEYTGTIANGDNPGVSMHPEVCVMAESKLKNRVYLRKYYHTRSHTGDGKDGLDSPAATAINNKLKLLRNGLLPGAIKACFPDGSLATIDFTCDPYLRTHQLKRRGRRPTG